MSVLILGPAWAKAPYKDGTLILFLALADSANDEGICWPSVSTLAQKSRMGDRHVRRLLQKFEEDGMISIERRGDTHQTSIYRINLEKLAALPTLPKCQGTPEEGGPGEPERVTPRSNKGGLEVIPTVSEPSIEPPEAPKPRNLLFDALCEIEGSNVAEIGNGGGRIAKALRDIKSSTPDLTPEEIRRRARNYRASWPTAALTANALATHWAKFGITHGTHQKSNGRQFANQQDYSGVTNK